MERRKGPLYNMASGRARAIRASGVPGRFWQIKAKDVGSPSNILVDRPWYRDGKPYQATPGQQQDWIRAILEGDALSKTSPIVAVGSEPGEDLGVVFGTAVIDRALDLKLKPRMQAAHKSPRDIDMMYPPGVFVLYNVATNASQFRCEQVRDWLTEMDDVFRVVLVSGGDPVSFFYDTLKHSFDQALYFRGQYNGEVGQRRV